MIKKRTLKRGFKRKTLDSSDEEDGKDYGQQGDEAVLEDASTYDGNSENGFYERPVRNNYNEKTGRVRNVQLPKQFLDSFIVDFNNEELAAKRTLESIYRASGSFSYTYRSIEEAFLLNEQVLKPFLKAMASVADEVFLVERLHSAKVGGGSSGNIESQLSSSLESLLFNKVQSMVDKFNADVALTDASAPFGTWKRFIAGVKCMFPGGLVREIKSCTFGKPDDAAATGVGVGVDLGKVLAELKSAISSLISAPNNKRQKRQKHVPDFQTWLKYLDEIQSLYSYLQGCHGQVYLHVVNCSQADGLERLISTLQAELNLTNDANSGNDDNAAVADLDEKIQVVGILLGNEACSCLSRDVLDCDFALDKFNDMVREYQESVKRKHQQNDEIARKTRQKREAVDYVLTRVDELQQTNLATCYNHPFFIVGIAPKVATLDVLRRCGRKLKTLLHPDTEQDPQWKLKAERAFKEASSALEKCSLQLESGVNFRHYRMGPPSPYAAFINLPDAGSDKGNGSAKGSSSPQSNKDDDEEVGTLVPNLMTFPKFQVRCDDAKTGSITILVDANDLFENGPAHVLGKNRNIHAYLHRPIHGDEPVSLTVASSCISTVQSVAIPDGGKQRVIHVKFDAVQPIVLGSAWKYYVGVQVSGDKGTSLITWKSIYIELGTRGRTANQILKLLTTFEKAPFVDQTLLRYKMALVKNANANERSEAEVYLYECAKLARQWADGN